MYSELKRVIFPQKNRGPINLDNYRMLCFNSKPKLKTLKSLVWENVLTNPITNAKSVKLHLTKPPVIHLHLHTLHVIAIIRCHPSIELQIPSKSS